MRQGSRRPRAVVAACLFVTVACDGTGPGDGLGLVPGDEVPRLDPGAVEHYRFTPTPAQWRAGARWARCDLGYVWDDPAGSLTGSLITSGGPRAEASAPRCQDSDGYLVPCEQPHATEVVAAWTDLRGEEPSEPTRPALGERRCRPLVDDYLGVPGDRVPGELRASVHWSSPWVPGRQSTVTCSLGYVVSTATAPTSCWARPCTSTPRTPGRAGGRNRRVAAWWRSRSPSSATAASACAGSAATSAPPGTTPACRWWGRSPTR
jgi:hypothetical protein